MLICAPIASAETVQIITAHEWARPRSGESLVQMPALKSAVREYLGEDSQHERRIIIRHPRGEEGVLWAEELRGWLVALGIPSAHIAVSPKSTRANAIEVAVSDAGN